MSFLQRMWEYITPRKTHAKVRDLEGNTYNHLPALETPTLLSRKVKANTITPPALSHTTTSLPPAQKVQGWRLASNTDGYISSAMSLKRSLSPRDSVQVSHRKRFRYDSAISGPYHAQQTKDDDGQLDATQLRLSGMSVSSQQGNDDSEVDLNKDDELSEFVDENDDTMTTEEYNGGENEQEASSEVVGRAPIPDQEHDELTEVSDEKSDHYPFGDESSGQFEDDTIVVSPASYSLSTPKRRCRMAPLPAESALLAKGVTTVELREKGWDDDHITLMQKLAMRGFEPLLPSWNKFGMRFMPDELFSETDDDAFISSARGMHSHSEKALLKLFQMGPNVRTLMKPGGRPEQAFVRGVREYTKWATRDSQLHEPGIIPLVATKARPENTPADILEAKAKRELERLAEMYRLAFTASPSIESPTPTTPPPLAYPLPTLYCLVASHTLVALAAYRCADANPQMHTVAMFDFVDKDYDVWNALAIAIILCHQRNMQIRMSEETGLGTRPPMWDAIQDDPDA